MDTVEQLDNTYFYDGMSHLSASELFFWIMVDETMDHFGIDDIAAVVAIFSGQNWIPVSGKFKGATPGTSLASKYSRKLFKDKFMPIHLPTLIGLPPQVKLEMTHKLGTFVGRTIPVIGWVVAISDVTEITYKSVRKYNTIVDPSDSLW